MSQLRWFSLVFVFSLVLMSCSDDKDDKTDKKSMEKARMKTRVIYGADNRLDLYNVSSNLDWQMAQSTVALFKAYNLADQGNGTTKVNGDNYGSAYSLCAEEPFREQSSAAFCSGFLVGHDLVATAGHCVRSAKDCQDLRFVFNWSLATPGQDSSIVNSDDVYSCAAIVKNAIENNGADYAVVRLNRSARNRNPMSVRRSGEIQSGAQLTMIGHPAGIPLKISGGANVRSVYGGYFSANTDSYGGNSGSAVYNSITGEVEGILVRGETDFVRKGNCNVSNVCTDSGCRGEDVTKIANILPYIN